MRLKGPPRSEWKRRELTETEIWKVISWKDIAATIQFWRKFPLSSIGNSKSLSVYEFHFLNLLQTSVFCQIYYHEIPWIILYKIWQIVFTFFSTNAIKISMIEFFTSFHYLILFLGTTFWHINSWKVFHDLIFTKVQHYVDVWLFNKDFNHYFEEI